MNPRAASSPARVPLSVAVAQGRDAQQAMIDAWAARAPAPRAVLVEGGLQPLATPDDTVIERLPAGCVCCVANVPMRVTLTRMLRQARPASALLVIAGGEHLPAIERMLTAPPLADAIALQAVAR